MSNSSQKRYLKKLAKMLETSGDYRTEVADKRTQNLVISRKALHRGITSALEYYFPKIKVSTINNILSDLEPYTDLFFSNIKVKVLSQPKDRVRVKRATKDMIVAVYFEDSSGTSQFDRAKNLYTSELSNLSKNLVKIIVKRTKKYYSQTRNKNILALDPGEIWQLEHFLEQGVLETYIRDSIDSLLDSENIAPADFENFLSKELKKLAPDLNLKIIRDPYDGTMNLVLGSRVLNAQEALVSTEARDTFREALQKAAKELQSNPKYKFQFLPGSDSMVELRNKKAVEKTLEPFNKVKNTKTVKRTKKVNARKSTSKTRVENKSKVVRGTKKLGRGSRKAPPSQSTKITGTGFSQLDLLAKINSVLPDTVAKNMHSPRLNYRTGEFARSARVIGVQKTPKGYPSIEYTYDKYPYQTFEPGFAQGSRERDPRELISMSIREIAAEMAIGRFYLRRL